MNLRLDKVVTHLRLDSLRELSAKAHAPQPLAITHATETDVLLVKGVHDEIGKDYFWKSRSDEAWREWLARPDTDTWLLHTKDDVCGMCDIEAQPDNTIETMYFGLRPDYVGKGYGGHGLTKVVEHIFEVKPETQRVWLKTDSYDHPAALHNYERRGFRVFHTTREVVDIATVSENRPV